MLVFCRTGLVHVSGSVWSNPFCEIGIPQGVDVCMLEVFIRISDPFKGTSARRSGIRSDPDKTTKSVCC